MSVLTVKKFSGSITDFPIGADSSEYEQADNVVLDEYENMVTRPGTLLEFTDSAARARVPTSNSTRRIALMCAQEVGADADFTALKVVGATIQYDNGTAMAELIGPSGDSAFDITGGIDDETVFTYSEWNKHTFITHDEPLQRPVKVYRDSAGDLQLRTAGLPKISDGFTATGGSNGNYIYALVVKYEYTVGDITYIDRGAPVLKEFTGIGSSSPGANPGITVGSIDVLTDAAGEHYDTPNLDIEIYRTQNDGTVLYLVGSVDDGVTSFADSTSDDDLVSNELLYTEGGVIANDRPPKCKYTHGTSDFVYWANGIEVGPASTDLELQPQRIWQSKRGDPDSVPASFYADLESPVTAISSVRSIPIAFTENATYRLDGFFDSLGRGGILPKKISDSVGCISHNSCVQTTEGIFFAGNDGFYYTDGYQVIGLSDKFRDTYDVLIGTDLRKKRIYGQLDLNEQWVLWTTYKASSEAYDDDCAQIYCLDLRRKAFTTWSSGFAGTIADTFTGTNSGADLTVATTSGIAAGSYLYRNVETAPLARGSFLQDVDDATGLTINYAAANETDAQYYAIDNDPENTTFRNFLPTALLFANDKMYYGDRHGYTLYFDEDQPDDVWLDPAETINPDSLDKLPIYYNYKGAFLDFGTTEYRKWVSMIIAKARPRIDINAEMTLQIKGENDDNDFTHSLQPIFFEQYYPWGTPLLDYGDPKLYRVRRNIIDVKRRFPAGKMRCEYKQVQFTPAFVKIHQSSVYGEATVAAGSGDHIYTATLSGTDTWPNSLYNYWILFEGDTYTAKYRIISRDSSTQITFHDPDDTVATGADIAWAIKGLKKQALINLIEYSLFYEVLGPSQTQYQGENTITQ